MKKILTYAALGALMTFGSAVSARANTVTYLFSASALYSAGFTAGGNCASNLTNCGILGIGLVSSSGGTITSASFIAPTLGATDAWTSYTNSTNLPGVISGTGMEESGSGMAFITQDTHVGTGNTYYTDNGAKSISGAAVGTGLSAAAYISSSTTLGFQVTYSGNVTGPVTLNLELVADLLSTSDGSNQGGSKTYAGTATLTGVTAQATPEPSSMILIFGGIAGIAVSRFRRNRA